ncbi:breast carcinoma-amplified sequence 1 isoform 2-T4 [Anomaloglossus baeobatrachus]|uniref:breast carcinoma-amplified sequence 1 isoform X2 n=1 Tax=Anomaloglossus baeobatrachus TaxID=238106 RepID=UPI003F4F8FB1
MGNVVSSSEVEEEQEGPIKESNPEFAVEVKNGPVTLQSSPALNSAPGGNLVSSKQVVQQESMITSTQKTIVLSPISNGSVTNPHPPAAKSKFRLTISRPSPGRTSFQPNGQEDVKPEIALQESPVVQTQLMAPIDPDSKAKENVGGIQNQAPTLVVTTPEASLPSANLTEEEMATTKPKEVSIFQRIFKIEKMQSTPQPEVTINEPVVITVDQPAGLHSSPPSDDLQSESVEDYDQAASAEEQSASEDTQNTPPAELHPVMSFFKTLVTPNKSVSKSEEDVKTEGENKKKENGGIRKSSSKKEKHKSTVQQASETEAKNLKKLESPKSGTLSRLFKQKSKKDEQQTSGSKVVVEQSVVSVSVNSEKSSPEQVLIQDPKSSDVPTQITASEGEGKAAKESTSSRPKLFWRKSFKGEPQPNKIQENGVEEQAALSVSANPTPEPISVQDTNLPDTNVQPQETEEPVVEPPSRPVPFWRKSFKGDPQPRKIQDNVVVEQPTVSVSINVEKSAPEQVSTQDTKPLVSDSQQPGSETPQKEAAARSVPFWRKSFKADPPPQKVSESVVVEQPVVSVSVNSEKSAPEQVLTLETKPLDSDTQQTEREKPQKEAAARPGLFWRKSFKGDPQPPKVQENSVPEEPQTVQLTLPSSSEPEPQSSKSNPGEKGATSGKKSPEAQSKKPEDGKTTKPKIMMFFKQLTLDITDGVEVTKNEKTVVTAVVEPPPPPPLKGKDNAKEKKASAEKLNKQESRESVEAAASAQIQAPDPVQVDYGVGASRDGQLKRTDKRQSLGSFFKAIGPKRMCDAEVQTDPVTIFPAEKSK